MWQITAAISLGLVILFGTFSAIAYNTINQSTNAALKEREALAALSARAIDNLVAHAAKQIESVSGMKVFRQGERDEIEAVLNDLRSQLDTFESLTLLDLNSDDVWMAPSGDSDHVRELLSYPGIVTAVETGAAQIFHAPPTHLESGHPALSVIAVPVPRTNGRVLVGELHLRGDDQRLVPLPQFSSTSGTTIIDGQGRVLAASNEAASGRNQDHFPLLPDFLAKRKSGVAMHRLADGNSHVVAFAPFELISGGVIVEEREDVVLAVSRRLRRNLILFGTLGLALTLVAGWLHVRRTMMPVKRLTFASKAIADGVLDQPVVIDRNDEIGALAQSFEVMRQRLLEAERQRVRWEQEMEERVEERTERIHTLLARVISAQEEERKRVARELHDEISQDLATSLITLQRLSQGGADLQPADRRTLEETEAQLGNTLKEMRRMISDLRPSALDDLGLEVAIRSYAESRAEFAGVRLHFETIGDIPTLEGVKQIALFRILQEAINNVMRHSGAENLSIRLEFSSDAVEAEVQDDGKGFDVASVSPAGDSMSHLGIVGMKERASLVSGNVEVNSRPGHGTRVRVWIPLSS